MQTEPSFDLSQRDLRQRDLVPPEKLAACHVTVVGVGAIGRQVALQLAAVGVPDLQLIDPDTVEPVNLASQGYFESDLGQAKVEATAALCRRLNSAVRIETYGLRFRRSQSVGNVVFACVDSITTRRHIFNAVRANVSLFIDGRMSAETLRVLTVSDTMSAEHYQSTLFTADEAFAGSCTGRTTIYCANVAAGLMVNQLALWLRRMPLDPDVMLNLTAGEWSVPGAPGEPGVPGVATNLPA